MYNSSVLQVVVMCVSEVVDILQRRGPSSSVIKITTLTITVMLLPTMSVCQENGSEDEVSMTSQVQNQSLSARKRGKQAAVKHWTPEEIDAVEKHLKKLIVRRDVPEDRCSVNHESQCEDEMRDSHLLVSSTPRALDGSFSTRLCELQRLSGVFERLRAPEESE
ncbi:hypothetical protein F2P81_017837 [Scophthalmus maximus]|uniref:Uncharacterized protein n=1 Tax=Scophthalmus maximus TaxID=52904 RepID=A0A6A4SDU9_SCOMX|nr:hypothetical protein F2P81_017837 [Scophthalmus maximus]